MSEADVTTEIKGFARLRIHSGKLQEFKDLQAQCMAVVRAKDSGTLQYEVFFNDDSSECIVYERYRDSDALLEHFSNLGALMPALFEVFRLRRDPGRTEPPAEEGPRRQPRAHLHP